MMRFSHLTIALSPFLLAACGGGTSESETPSPQAATADTGDSGATALTEDVAEVATAGPAQPARLAQCKVCHTFEEGGRNGVGPNLWDVHGNPAAAHPDFAYSAALRDAGLVWDDATLDAYLTNPRQLVPGGKMSFAGLRDEGDRAEIIAYMKAMSPEGGSAE